MNRNIETKISSVTKTVTISHSLPTVIIGERINPTGRKAVLAALSAGNLDVVRQDAEAQVAAGAAILDVNAGVPGADEPVLLEQVMQAVMEVTDVPLCIDTANPKALERALAAYQGRALVNSVNGEEPSLSAVLPLVKEHDAVVIGLCMDDSGIPETPEQRLAVAAKIIERAGKLGIGVDQIVIDPLAMTMGADHTAGLTTIKTTRLIVSEFGVNITMGASNVSFGLPDREHINATFMAMAIQAGLTCPITNPLSAEVSMAVLGANLVMGRDSHSMRWIKAYRKRKKEAAKS